MSCYYDDIANIMYDAIDITRIANLVTFHDLLFSVPDSAYNIPISGEIPTFSLDPSNISDWMAGSEMPERKIVGFYSKSGNRDILIQNVKNLLNYYQDPQRMFDEVYKAINLDFRMSGNKKEKLLTHHR